MPTPIHHVKTDKPYIALTFDDGPIPETSPQWIELFAKHDCKATFFDLGNKVIAEPNLAQDVFAAGHEIGNHSMTHPHLPELSLSEVREQLVDCQKLFEDTFGIAPKVFRAPFGEHSDHVWTVLGELGLPAIMGKSYSDWAPDATVEAITENYTKDTVAGDIYILHTWQVKTLEAMPEMIRRYKARGLQLVTVSELMAAAK
ncbi:polysaccharide deacetylase family protein [Cerasicoccus fimbriatus]|uniref:polysaccharide deacetylase family protein n=1 Tax=Cerasicoccus fimbriatus TaxID=3014554 RepID=UPI0022B2E57A|nr:polysaccharide deacetylase family protein [Cerasicoccus sp. TK19100]